MSVNSQIIAAVSDIAPCYPWEAYEGSEDATLSRYFVFNYVTAPYAFGDDDAPFERYVIQLHFFCPLEENTVRLRRRIKNLIAQSFTRPLETNASDSDGQHYVFEFEALGTTKEDVEDGNLFL